MKKCSAIILALALSFGGMTQTHAQIQEGNLMVGGNLMGLDATFGDNSSFNLNIVPKIGYFIKDNIAIGANVGLHYTTTHAQGNTFRYEIGAFGRYYFGANEVEPLLKHGRFFAEANAGIGGNNSTPVGFNFGFGPGYSYFITPNVGLEGLVKLNGTAGVGSSVGLSFGLGFQIYLPTKKARAMYHDVSDEVKSK